MFNISKETKYACGRCYHVFYDRNHCGHEQKANGLLLRYVNGNIVLLSEEGIYHIKDDDIMFMGPGERIVIELDEELKMLLRGCDL